MKLHLLQKEFVEGRGYSMEDWNAVDSPEMTEEQIAQLRPFKEVFPDIHALIEAEAKKEALKDSELQQRVSLTLDTSVIAHFKATGKGWQQRINDALKKELAI